MALNSHFVSRFLTQPWEFGQRRLWYYDFDTDRFDERSSRSLFATFGLYSDEVEKKLDYFIETPLSNAHAQLLGRADEGKELDLPWSVFRALALLVLLQPLRVADPEFANTTLTDVLSRPDAEIDHLAQAISSRYRFMRITVGRNAPLLYPSAGYFPLIGHRVDGGCAAAFAVPISPWHVVISVPREIEWSVGPEVWSQNGAGFVSTYSVGTSKRIIIHPAARGTVDESALRSMIVEMRGAVSQAMGLCKDLAGVLRKIDALYPTEPA